MNIASMFKVVLHEVFDTAGDLRSLRSPTFPQCAFECRTIEHVLVRGVCKCNSFLTRKQKKSVRLANQAGSRHQASGLI